MSQPLLAINYFFHLVATVVWLGGLVIMVLLVWPAARHVLAEDEALYRLLQRIRRRFLPLTHFSLVVLIVTGLLQMTADSHYEGVLQISNEWSRVILLKHIAIGGMFICGLALQYGVAPALERASLLAEHGKGDPVERDRLLRREVRLTWASVILGMLVLGFTAWATA
ncbi:MAG: CopD family protein, partial [Burkholderiales bacterium]|nr:CopD family protein [Anaerolineae bacterium]